MDALPFITAALPGLGGQIGPHPEDFQVDELPAYPPSGEGTHFFVRIKKRGCSTGAAKLALARAAGIDERDIGTAGRKDAQAVTTQWFSLPVAPVAPEDDRITLLEQAPHNHKLRMGHLRGNRFTIRLLDVCPEAEARFPALAARLALGFPNYFGAQRFGRDNLERGLGLLDNPRARVKDPRFLASAVQSAVFNAWLAARVKDGLLDQALLGDVLKKRETGGLFVSEEAEVDAARVASGEVDPTGPLPGPKCKAAQGLAAEREAAALAALELTEARLAVLARFAPGDRRLARVVPADLSLQLSGTTATVSFCLPAGAFATTLLAELIHPEGPLRAEDVD